jgi:hypothetical protein
VSVDCAVTVVDANDSPLAGATVTLADVRGSTDQSGAWMTTIADPAAPLRLGADHPFHVPEWAVFDGNLQSAPWNNALVGRAATGRAIRFTVRLGRADSCPIAEFPKSEIQ